MPSFTTIELKDAQGVSRWFRVAGTGTSVDPFIPGELAYLTGAQAFDTASSRGLIVAGTDAGGLLRFLKADATTRALLVQLAAGAETIGAVTISGTPAVAISSLPSLTAQLLAGAENIGAVMDNGPAWTPKKGVSDAIFSAADATGATNWLTDTPSSTQKICVDDMLYSVAADVTLELIEETSGTVLRRIRAKSAAGTQQITLRNGLRTLTNQKRIRVVASGATQVDIELHYHFI